MSSNTSTRWLLFGTYWFAQWVLAFFIWMTFFYGRTGDLKWSVWTNPIEAVASGGTILPGAILAAFIALAGLQAVFLWPVRKPVFGLRGTPLWLSLTAAGLAAAGLLTAALLALVDAVWLITTDTNSSLLTSAAWIPWTIGAFVVISWGVATPLLVSFCRRRGGHSESLLARIAARLFLGTLIESAAIIPIDVLVRRRQPCYCEQGTFWALTICMSVGIFALGPAILLPILSRRRKRWYAGRCDACGYDMAGTPTADRCPECGAGWRP